MRVIIGLGIAAIVLSSTAAAQPKMKVAGGEEFSFGELYKGDRVERKVTIRNIGTDTLRIDRVQASCGCTAALLSEKIVPPGKETTVSIGFDSKTFGGPVTKTVHVFSNDPSQPAKEIKFTATIREAVTATPSYIYFPKATVDSALSTVITLGNTTNAPIEVLGISTQAANAKFDVQGRTIAPNGTATVRVTYTPNAPGYVNQDVVIKTSHPKQKELTLKLVSNVRPGTLKQQP